MFKQLLTFVYLLVSFLSVHGGESLQMTNPDNGIFPHQTKRSSAGSSQYKLPYTGEIRHPMFDGKEIHIEGTFSQNESRFTVELCEAESCCLEPEFQIDICFNTKKLIMNYVRDDESREPTVYEGIPFEAGGPLNITLTLNLQNIKVLAGRESYTFNAIVPLTKIKFIRISGLAQIKWILYSYAHPPEKVYFNGQLQEKRFIIFGTPNSTDKTFSFNFKKGHQPGDTGSCTYGNVAAHLFVWFFHRRRIGLDSKPSAAVNWSHRRTHMHFPFETGVPFKLQVTIIPNKYEFHFDDGFVWKWDHRTDEIDMLCYNGHLTVENLLTT